MLNDVDLLQNKNTRSRGSVIRAALVIPLLIIIFQLFFYMKDFPLIYVAAKIVAPVIVVLFTLLYVMAASDKIKFTWDELLVLVSFFYLTAVSAITAHFNYEQPLYLGLAWQIKLLPLLFFFSVHYLLKERWLQLNDLYLATMLLSVFALLSYVYINAVVSPEMYIQDESYFFVHDSKGFRLRFPDVPVLLGLFIFFWRWRITPKLIDGVIAASFLTYFILIHQQRFLLLCLLLLLVYRLWCTSTAWMKSIWLMLIPIIFTYLFFSDSFSFLFDIEDASYISRMKTIEDIFEALSSSIIGIIFGYGNMSSEYDGGFKQLYGPYFWLSDVGWLGLLYEYGLLGVLLILVLLFRMIRYAERIVIFGNPFLLAMRDLVWITILVSVIAPRMIYISGVTATMFAILMYASRNIPRN